MFEDVKVSNHLYRKDGSVYCVKYTKNVNTIERTVLLIYGIGKMGVWKKRPTSNTALFIEKTALLGLPIMRTGALRCYGIS
jgi:hypothetical protein